MIIFLLIDQKKILDLLEIHLFTDPVLIIEIILSLKSKNQTIIS